MATRNTQEQAEQLKAEFETRYPARQFRIVDNSGTMTVGKMAAITNGYEVIEDGDITVLAKVTQFDVLEVRYCNCGAETLTGAIGEDGPDKCKICRARYLARFARELRKSETQGLQAVQDQAHRDAWENGASTTF